MIYERFAFLPIIAIMVTSLILLVSQSWRQQIIALAVQYLCAFWLFALIWPLGLASVKLVVGWMCGAALAATQPVGDTKTKKGNNLAGQIFRGLAASMVWLLVFSISGDLQTWLPGSVYIMVGGSLLIAMGLLQLGMNSHPLQVILGLLTMLSGFEILYATVETSVLVAGLLAVVNLSLALVGSYFITAPFIGEQL